MRSDSLGLMHVMSTTDPPTLIDVAPGQKQEVGVVEVKLHGAAVRLETGERRLTGESAVGVPVHLANYYIGHSHLQPATVACIYIYIYKEDTKDETEQQVAYSFPKLSVK